MNMLGANGQLFGWSEATWLWLDQAGILVGDVMLVLTIAGGLWAWFSRDTLRRWFMANRFPAVGDTDENNETWSALVFTVSHSVVPCWVLERKRPRAIGLVASAESREAAGEVARHARALGMAVAGPKLIDDPDDPAETREETSRLIERLRREGNDTLAVDVTGGKTPMSLGAFMAAEEARCATLYVSTRYDPALKRPDMGTARIHCISRPVES